MFAPFLMLHLFCSTPDIVCLPFVIRTLPCCYFDPLICGLLLCIMTMEPLVGDIIEVSIINSFAKNGISWIAILTFSSFRQRFLRLLINRNGCERCVFVQLLHDWQHRRCRDGGEINSSCVTKNGMSQSILLTFLPFLMRSPSLQTNREGREAAGSQ